MRIFEDLRGLGYTGGYDAVRRYAAAWRRRENGATASAFVPLSFPLGEAYQFDWSREIVLLNGVTTIVKDQRMMGGLKLFGMKAAYDDIVAVVVKRKHEPQRIIGDLLTTELSEKHTPDEVPAHDRQAADCQGDR